VGRVRGSGEGVGEEVGQDGVDSNVHLTEQDSAQSDTEIPLCRGVGEVWGTGEGVGEEVGQE